VAVVGAEESIISLYDLKPLARALTGRLLCRGRAPR